MIRLTQNQIQQKIDFISQYLQASNAATASQVDANANVTSKNIATMEAEINKDYQYPNQSRTCPPQD